MTDETQLERILGLPSRQVVPYVVPTLMNEFDFFNILATRQNWSKDQIAAKWTFDDRVLDATLGYLCKEGFLEQRGSSSDPAYCLSESTHQNLTNQGEYNLSSYATILSEAVPERIPKAIIQALKTGKSASWFGSGETWQNAMKSGAISKGFSEGMMSRGKLLRAEVVKKLKDELSQSRRLIDVGGSLGDYCGAFTQSFPAIECAVYDLPAVIEHAQRNITEKGYQRVRPISGDMFKEALPKGFDTHFYSNVLHDWTPKQVQELLRKSYQALDNPGKVMVHDIHLNPDKQSPSFVVDHSLYLAIFTQGRCYSLNEMESFMHQAGFRNVEQKNTIGGFSVITGEKK